MSFVLPSLPSPSLLEKISRRGPRTKRETFSLSREISSSPRRPSALFMLVPFHMSDALVDAILVVLLVNLDGESLKNSLTG